MHDAAATVSLLCMHKDVNEQCNDALRRLQWLVECCVRCVVPCRCTLLTSAALRVRTALVLYRVHRYITVQCGSLCCAAGAGERVAGGPPRLLAHIIMLASPPFMCSKGEGAPESLLASRSFRSSHMQHAHTMQQHPCTHTHSIAHNIPMIIPLCEHDKARSSMGVQQHSTVMQSLQ